MDDQFSGHYSIYQKAAFSDLLLAKEGLNTLKDPKNFLTSKNGDFFNHTTDHFACFCSYKN